MAKSSTKPAAKLNMAILDEVNVHAVDLARLEVDQQRRILRELKRLEKDLLAQLVKVDPTVPLRPTYRQKRLEKLLLQTQGTIKTAYGQVHKGHKPQLRQLAEIESSWATGVLNPSTHGIPIELSVTGFTSRQLKGIVSDVMIAGAPTKTWWAKQAGDLQFRFEREMRQGMLQGEGVGDLIRRVRGTRAGNFTDGIMRASRQHAEMLVRSSVQTVANRVREDVWAANAKLLSAIMWASTMDVRTTVLCAVRDGMRYSARDHKPIGHGYPWGGGPGSLHPNCRSTTCPVVASADELGITVDEGTRSSIDGYLPRSMTYEKWLKGKPPEFQAEVLGKGKAQLWRNGKITFRDLVNQKGRPLRLDELKAKVRARKRGSK